MDGAVLVALLGGLGVSMLLALAGLRRRVPYVWLAFAVALAATGELFVLRGDYVPGGPLYGAAVIVFLAWLWRFREWDLDVGHFLRWRGRTEWLLFALVAVVIVFGRLYLVGDYPYGLEGDESKWTWEAGHIFYSDERPEGASYHLKYLPVSFYQERIFFELFGMDFMSPRYEVAFFSILATFLFYLLVRQLANVPVALIATLLLAASTVDLSASRVALVESHIKIWVILSYLLFVLALGRRSILLLLLTGGVLTLGLLTYETFYLTVPVIVLYYLLVAVRERARWRRYSIGLVALLAPMLMVAPRVREYLDTRSGYQLGIWEQFTRDNPADGFVEASVRAVSYGVENLGDAFDRLFHRQTTGDFLLVRPDDPIVLAAVAPFAVLGALWLLFHFRERHNTLIILWALVQIFALPVALAKPWVRVFYAGLPAVYVVAAVGMVLLTRAALGSARTWWRVSFVGSFGTLLALMAVAGLLMYFKDMEDPSDRTGRRELTDTVISFADPSTMVLLPHHPYTPERVTIERNAITFAMGSKLGISNARNHFEFLAYGSLLASLPSVAERFERVAIVHDREMLSMREQREGAMAAVRKCYPGQHSQSRKHFDVVVLDAEALASPRCRGDVTVLPVSPPDEAVVSPSDKIDLRWTTEPLVDGEFTVSLERRRPLVLEMQAEDFSKEEMWYEENEFAQGFTGRGYLGDHWHAGRAQAQVSVPTAGDYRVWLRSFRRALDETQPYLVIDGTARRPFGASAPGQVHQWVWEDLGRMHLTSGAHLLTLEKRYGPPPHSAIFVDAVILSADAGFDPNTQALWDQIANWEGISEDELIWDGSSYTCEDCSGLKLPAGEYRWRVQVKDDDRLVGSYGELGIWSDFASFRVMEEPARR